MGFTLGKGVFGKGDDFWRVISRGLCETKDSKGQNKGKRVFIRNEGIMGKLANKYVGCSEMREN